MIIIDISQTIISNIMVSPEMKESKNLNLEMVRSMVLKTIKSFNNKFKNEYGKLVIAVDAGNTWRREYFPYYKVKRREAHAESVIDWKKVYEIIRIIKNELKETFPYPVIEVEGAEADDVIASLCKHFGEEGFGASEKILILSRDKDFIQLHKYSNVDQFDPIGDKWIRNIDPELYLKEHIIRGDSGDSIPNILSADDCFALKIRQKSIMTKKVDVWLGQDWKEFCDEDTLKRVERNTTLIDLTRIPPAIGVKVIEEYSAQQGKPRNKIFNYMIKNGLTSLMDDLQDF